MNGEFCHWPRESDHPKRKGSFDTTKVNMGRRKMPRCSIPTCRLRVDAPGDEMCRFCRKLAAKDQARPRV